MILAHLIVGAFPVEVNEFSWLWFIGSVIPDIDHLYVLAEHRIYKWRKIVDSLRFEKKYRLCYRTKYMHSLFGALIVSLPVLLISGRGAIYFFLAYIVHLLLDWPDIDEKQYLYPLKIKFKGFLPIFSMAEKVFTAGLLAVYLIIFYIHNLT